MDVNSAQNSIVERTIVEPRWVTIALKFLPVPVFAFAIVATLMTVAAISAIFADMEGSLVGWIISAAFAATSVWLASAMLTRSFYRRRGNANSNTSPRYAASRSMPSFVILVLLVSSCTWMLMIAIHVFDIFFAGIRLGNVKYFLTLGIAFASTLYMTLHGRFVIRRYLGLTGGLNLMVTPGQAILVVVFMITFSAYCTWVLS